MIGCETCISDDMTLLEAIRQLADLDPQHTIYASQPWLLSSTAVVTQEPPDCSLPSEAIQQSCVLFIDVVVARASRIAWCTVHGREPSAEEFCYKLIDSITTRLEQAMCPEQNHEALE